MSVNNSGWDNYDDLFNQINNFQKEFEDELSNL
jgi:hypothetical protein